MLVASSARLGLRSSVIGLPLLSRSRLATGRTLPLSQCLASRSSLRYLTATLSDSAQSPSPSRLRRFFSFVAIALLSTSAGFALTFSPAVPVMNDMLSPPSDAETLTMFTPSTEKIAEEEKYIQTHPLVLELRANPDFTESRPLMKIPASVRQHHLTGGILSGQGRLEVPPLQFTEKDGKSAITIFYIGTDLCGHRGLVHGGAMATLLDEALARCCFPALPSKVGMTANLNINYRKPMPAGSFALIRSATTKVEGRKAWVVGTLESLPPSGEDKVVYCEADALFIEPRQAAAMAALYAAAA